ncbi:hypothetical protein Tco_0732555 [Tanacetum coccineum]
MCKIADTISSKRTFFAGGRERRDEVRQQKVDAKIDSLYELYGDYEFNIDTMHDSLGARNDDEMMDELHEIG